MTPISEDVAPLRCLVADDDPIARALLVRLVSAAGFEVLEAENGTEAWRVLDADDAPPIALLDWMMPGLEGTEICRRVRASKREYAYLILLTARGAITDMVEGFSTGADDYMSKPYNQAELTARLRCGERIVRLQQAVRRKVIELEAANSHVRELQGLLPICMFCKKIRDRTQVWRAIETYLSDKLGTKLSHALCQDCLNTHYGDLLDD